MPLSLAAFVRLRPRLFHLTDRQNVDRILRNGELISAAVTFESAGMASATRLRRKESVMVGVNGAMVHVRDQKPLHEKCMALAEGCTFGDFVECVNQHVFFWPGDSRGPISSGRNYMKRYSREDAVVLSIPTEALLRANPDRAPLFSSFNSGSPRMNRGLGSPRGLDTFMPADRFDRSPGAVIEFVYRDRARLPVVEIERFAPSSLIR